MVLSIHIIFQNYMRLTDMYDNMLPEYNVQIRWIKFLFAYFKFNILINKIFSWMANL